MLVMCDNFDNKDWWVCEISAVSTLERALPCRRWAENCGLILKILCFEEENPFIVKKYCDVFRGLIYPRFRAVLQKMSCLIL